MDAIERQELLSSLEEVKQLVDEVLPLESSVVRDQILSMLTVAVVQPKLMAKFIPQTVAKGQFDINQLVGQMNETLTRFKELEHEKMATTLTQVTCEMGKQIGEQAKAWTWDTFQYFLKMTEGMMGGA